MPLISPVKLAASGVNGVSLSVIVSVCVVVAPRVAPPPGAESWSASSSVPSTAVSSVIDTLMFCVVTPVANVSVPALICVTSVPFVASGFPPGDATTAKFTVTCPVEPPVRCTAICTVPAASPCVLAAFTKPSTPACDASLSVIVSVCVVVAPRVAPPPGAESCSASSSVPSTAVSSVIDTLMFCVVTPSANVSVPALICVTSVPFVASGFPPGDATTAKFTVTCPVEPPVRCTAICTVPAASPCVLAALAKASTPFVATASSSVIVTVLTAGVPSSPPSVGALSVTVKASLGSGEASLVIFTVIFCVSTPAAKLSVPDVIA